MDVFLVGIFCLMVLPSIDTTSYLWKDGPCGLCKCYQRIGQFERIEYVVNCSRSTTGFIPDDLPRNIHILDLSYNSFGNSSLENLGLYGNSLISISLAYNNISYIDANVFSKLILLEELNLQGNLLNHVDEHLLSSLKLRILLGIKAKLFHRKSFLGMEMLSVVFVQESIPEDIFKRISVFHLDVVFLNAKSIPTRLFEFGANTLTTLSINGPKLHSLHDDIFKGLTVLKTLTIQGNNMRWLSKQLFQRHPKIKIPRNIYKITIKGVRAIPRDLLIGQKSLKFVSLRNVEDIPPLELPVQLDSLDLSGSNVHSISQRTFENLQNLRELLLSNSSLMSLDDGAFHGLLSLFRLDLSKNMISNLPMEIFQPCRNTLETLDLSYNNLQKILKSYFSSVKSLRILNLSHNQVNYIEQTSFDDLGSLTTLYFSDNHVTILPENLFFNLRSLQFVDLAHNSISNVPATLFAKYNKLESVNLENNPLHCNCDIKQVQTDNLYTHFHGVCKSPPVHNGIQLGDLKPDESCYATTSSREDTIISTVSELGSSVPNDVLSHSLVIHTSQMTPRVSFVNTERNKNVDSEPNKAVTLTKNEIYSAGVENNFSPTPVDDLLPTSLLDDPLLKVKKTHDHGAMAFLIYTVIAIAAVVFATSVVFGCKTIVDKYRQRGTYILPPPKNPNWSIE